MKVLTKNNEIKEIKLYGQLSNTGVAFDKGYHISLMSDLYFFAEGEEEQRDQFLTEMGIYDDDTPTWDDLYEQDDDSFYYSEWYVDGGLDGGYDSEGNYYEYEGLYMAEVN